MPELEKIGRSIGATIIGETNKEIIEPVVLDRANTRQDVLMWCRPGNENVLKDIEYGNIICEHVDPAYIRNGCTYLVVKNPRKAFQQAMKLFFSPKIVPGISASAYIGNNVQLGADIFIGHHVVIEDDCKIGNHCIIDHNTVIKSRTIIGDRSRIGCNTSVGSDGFGYEKNEDLHYELIPHIGNVVIETDVEIGDNVVIDRAMMGSTTIGANSKIDNLSYVAHGVTIGQNCLVIGGAIICGSVKIADNVWIAPNSTLINKIHIGENAVTGIGAVVLKSIPASTTVAGNPARILNNIKS